MAIRGIGFDYLGVTALLPQRFADIFTQVGQLVNVDPDKVRASYRSHSRQFQIGEFGIEEVWKRVADDIDRSDQLAAIFAASRQDTPIPSKTILDLVDRLRKNGYQTGLLSNLGSGTEWDAALYKAGVDKHFDAVILSGDLGVAKPDPRAFEALADAMDVSTNEMVFVDDRESAVAGVESIGVRPVIYHGWEHSIDDLTRDLKALGVKI